MPEAQEPELRSQKSEFRSQEPEFRIQNPVRSRSLAFAAFNSPKVSLQKLADLFELLAN